MLTVGIRGFVVLDVETTGLRANDEMVEFACLVVDGAGAVQQVFDTLLCPSRTVGPSGLHGVTREMCATAPSFGEIAGNIHDLLVGRVLVGHHLRFDWRMLRRTFEMEGVRFLREAQGLCTARMARAAGLPGGLGPAARSLGVESHGPPHTALGDAWAAYEVWLRLRPEQGSGTPLPSAVGEHRLPRGHPDRLLPRGVVASDPAAAGGSA